VETALQLYGSLILTLLGFVLPILTILLSLFSDGIKTLEGRYENEKKQSQDNIGSELKKQQDGKDLNIESISKSIKALRDKRRQAEIKLSYLKPNKLLMKISVPFILAFVGVLVATQSHSIIASFLCLVGSVLSFICGIYYLLASIAILIEITEIVNQAKKNTDEKIVELLSVLVDQDGKDDIFLEENKTVAEFNGRILGAGATFEFAVNKPYEIPVSIVNKDEKMAKKVELGFVFPEDFLIEKTSNLSIYSDDKTQIIRFKQEFIQSHENNEQGKIKVTFLKSGEYKVETFLKGENVKYRRFVFSVKVID